MGKKKIALVDLSQSETHQLKATGVRSQKLSQKKQPKTIDVPVPVTVPVEPLAPEIAPEQTKGRKKRVKHGRSKRYLLAKNLVDKTKAYSLDAGVKLLRQVSTTKFDSSVEIHLNLICDKLSGEISLPHGTGKKLKVEIASDAILAKIKDGVIDFDILVAEPKFMPKLAQYAKLLGPKGLMPNPKTNTISDKPEAIKTKLEAGATRYKSEPKAPLIHLVIGKLSFTDDQLVDNLKAVIKTVLPKNIASAYICSSMSPSIKLQL